MRGLGLLLVGLSLCVACSSDDTTQGGAGGGNPWGSGGQGGNGGGGNGGGGSGSGGGGGSGLPDGLESCADDSISAGLGKAANIVWAIDTSGSMDEEAALVQNNMNRFVESIVRAGLEDYRVVVVSQTKFVTVPAPLGTDAEHFRYIEEKVGSNEPLEDLLDRFDDYQDFLLPGAITHYVVVTDDESDISANEFISDMGRELNGAPFRVHAIASPDVGTAMPGGKDKDRACKGTYGDAAAPGIEHYEAADSTGGLKFSICEADWSGLFSALATEVGQSAGIPCDIPIPASSGDKPINPWSLNLVVTDGNGQTHVIPNVSRDQCASGGFSYNDDKNPTRLVLCPITCDAAAEAQKLEIVVGCSTDIL